LGKVTIKAQQIQGGGRDSQTFLADLLAVAVHFGATRVTAFVSDTATQIVLVSPAGVAGVVYVKVTTAGGTSTASSAAKYTYTAIRAKTPVHAASVTDSALLAVLNEDADPLSQPFQKKTADLAGN
jgi:hypothetical protein